MLMQSQPLSAETAEKLKTRNPESQKADDDIVSQHMGHIFDDILNRNKKPGIATRIGWKWRSLKDNYHDAKNGRRNRKIWRKTICGLRPWDGFGGMINVMQTHLRDYVETEEKYGCSLEEHKQCKIATAKETVELLERMKEPHDYMFRRREEVDEKYPKYKHLITHCARGSVSTSGDFIAQDSGWVGIEAGKDPREGYFEFVGGRFELAESPDPDETGRLLIQVKQYHQDIHDAYRQAEVDSDADFDRLAELLKENMYTWWD